MTEQEDIARLRGTPVPDAEGFVFGDDIGKNGDIFDVDVIREDDGASAGTARGKTSAEVVAHAQEIARGD